PVEASAAGRLVLLVLLLFPLVAAAPLVVLMALRRVVARLHGLVHAKHRVCGVLGGPDHTHATSSRQRPCRDGGPGRAMPKRLENSRRDGELRDLSTAGRARFRDHRPVTLTEQVRRVPRFFHGTVRAHLLLPTRRSGGSACIP